FRSRCHSVGSWRSPSFRYEVFVASESVVTVLPFGVVFVSALLPRKPMSSTLLRYIFFSPFVPICLGRPKSEWSLLPSPGESRGQPTEWIFWGQTVGGTKTARHRIHGGVQPGVAIRPEAKPRLWIKEGERWTGAIVEPLATWRGCRENTAYEPDVDDDLRAA